jgi:hypothetical protein
MEERVRALETFVEERKHEQEPKANYPTGGTVAGAQAEEAGQHEYRDGRRKIDTGGG